MPSVGVGAHGTSVLGGLSAKQEPDIVLYLTIASLSLAFISAIAAHAVRDALAGGAGTSACSRPVAGADRRMMAPACGAAIGVCHLACSATHLQLLLTRIPS